MSSLGLCQSSLYFALSARETGQCVIVQTPIYVAVAVLDQIASRAENMQYSVVQGETERVCFDVVDNLLRKTKICPSEV